MEFTQPIRLPFYEGKCNLTGDVLPVNGIEKAMGFKYDANCNQEQAFRLQNRVISICNDHRGCISSIAKTRGNMVCFYIVRHGS